MKRDQGFLDHLLSIVYCLLSVVFCLSPVAIQANDIDAIIEHIQKEYSTIKDIRGRFSQRSFLNDLERTESYSGRFFIKKPSGIRWEYSEPRDEVVIISGDSLWIYKRSERQVLKGAFEESSYNQLPIALLQSMNNLKKDFYVKAIKDDTLELTPKDKMGIIKKIDLVINTEGFPVREFTIHDVYDNTVTIKIDDVDINTGIDDSVFSFQIPSDAEVFDLNQ